MGMKEKKPVLLSRLGAWIVDSALALVLAATAFSFTAVPERINPALQDLLSSSKVLEAQGLAFQESLKSLQSQMTPEQMKALEVEFEKSFKTTAEKFFTPGDGNVQISEETVKQSILQAVSQVKPETLASLSPEALKSLNLVTEQFTQIVSQVKFWDLLVDLIPLLLKLLVIPMAVILAYFLPEALMGSSLGQLIFRVKTGTADGHKANILQYIIRYLLKHSGLILIAAGIWWSQPLVGFSGLGIALIMNLSVFSVLSSKRQMLYESLSMTALWKKSQLTLESQE